MKDKTVEGNVIIGARIKCPHCSEELITSFCDDIKDEMKFKFDCHSCKKEIIIKVRMTIECKLDVVGEFVKIRSSTLISMGEIGTQINLTYKCGCGKVFHAMYLEPEDNDDAVATCPACNKTGRYVVVEKLEWIECQNTKE